MSLFLDRVQEQTYSELLKYLSSIRLKGDNSLKALNSSLSVPCRFPPGRVMAKVRAHFSRPARTLREDFCGTGLLACRWVKESDQNRAWGIDLDPEPLEWGNANNVSKLTSDQSARLKLIEGDVCDIGHEKVEVTVAFNFS